MCLETRRVLTGHVDKWLEAVGEARLHTEALTGMKCDLKAAEAKIADCLRKARNRTKSWLEEAEFPSPMARAMADLLHSLGHPPENIT